LIAVPFGTVLFEEIAFRGVLPAMFLKRLRRLRHPKLKADLLASLLFGVWHILPSWDLDETNPIFKDFLPVGFSQFFAIAGGVLATAVFGMLFTWMRNRSDSLAAPMLLHITSNSAGYLIAWFAQNW
jgi:membrane protease YdiL (CAAX protease family)